MHETVGIVYLTDLMYILKQLNFSDILTQPVMKFVMNLNGTDEDRKSFKENLRKEIELVQGMGEGLPHDDHSAHHSFTTAHKKSQDKQDKTKHGDEDSEYGGVSMHNEEDQAEEDENAE